LSIVTNERKLSLGSDSARLIALHVPGLIPARQQVDERRVEQANKHREAQG